jgi:hypothetical protein
LVVYRELKQIKRGGGDIKQNKQTNNKTKQTNKQKKKPTNQTNKQKSTDSD